jgi:hypothetical protein
VNQLTTKDATWTTTNIGSSSTSRTWEIDKNRPILMRHCTMADTTSVDLKKLANENKSRRKSIWIGHGRVWWVRKNNDSLRGLGWSPVNAFAVAYNSLDPGMKILQKVD